MSALPMDYRDYLNRQDVVDRARLVPAQVIKVVPAQDDLVTALFDGQWQWSVAPRPFRLE
jgi:hypothetical protein